MQVDDISNRFTYHPPKADEQLDKYKVIRSVAKELAFMINDSQPDSREKSLAITSLEEAVMWANAGIARNT